MAITNSWQLAQSMLMAGVLLCLSPLAQAALEWPQEVTAPEGTIVVYQPQPEALEGNRLSGRAAVALEIKGRAEPIFGAMWFSARLDTDRDAGTATVRDLKVTRVGWPESRDADEQRFTTIVEGAMPGAGFEISLERLSASLSTAEVEQRSLKELKNDPPVIKFADELAVLLVYDGAPKFSPVEKSSYERALNTPFLVMRDTRSKACYLSDGSSWYTARDPLGPWQSTDQPPADLVAMVPPPEEEAAAAKPAPIVVATEPTELIATAGAPEWQSLPGGELLYVQNTETPWLRQLSTGNMYILLSGRWYRSKSQDGPWTFVPADELPASFAEIPPDSSVGGLRVSVAGTEEAEDAMLDAAVPQTAAIKRDAAGPEIEYDGAPEFESIKGTEVAYAVNTAAQVLLVDKRYYAVDEGVWYTSAKATGPWRLADTVPEDKIAEIPPSSPVYNTTHVHIYESTPEVVYVGYTPGYLWSFPYYGVPVYGTGWRYPPYWGGWYYPRPPTWGFHVGYNPWTGWNFGVSWSNGFFSFGMSWGGGYGGGYRPGRCCGGWYGGGYRGPTIINTGDINIGNTVNVGNRQNIGNHFGGRDGKAARSLEGRNLYNRDTNRARRADPATAQRSLKKARPAPARANDVYADRSGAVARRDGDSWQTRADGQWQRDDAGGKLSRENAGGAADRIESVSPHQREQAAASVGQRSSEVQRPAGGSAHKRPQIDRSELNRHHQARDMGRRQEMRRPAGRGGTMRRR